MNEVFLSSILFGVMGGLVRAVVGIVKYLEKNKRNGKMNPRYFALSLFVAALIGGIAGAIMNGDWRLSIIIGYAGTDFVEGLYKIRKKHGFEI